MKKITVLLFLLLPLFYACSPTSKSTTAKPLSKAEQVLAEAIAAHGGKRYATSHYSFVFRKKTYTFKNDQANYSYTVTSTKDGQEIVDRLDNTGLSRMIAGKAVALSEKDQLRYSGGLNSVIYFATLPYKLQDPAVKTAYQGITTIKGKSYEVLEVRFAEENGGRDHDDVFYYWINQESHRIDYLAYNYRVNNGGVRFRSAYNSRVVGGILFQDYINYKAPVGTPLVDLPGLYEKEKLKELSVIATEEVINLK